MHSAMPSWQIQSSVCLSVCLSVRLSHAVKRQNRSSSNQSCTVAYTDCSFITPNTSVSFQLGHPNGKPNTGRLGVNSAIFSANIGAYCYISETIHAYRKMTHSRNVSIMLLPGCIASRRFQRRSLTWRMMRSLFRSHISIRKYLPRLGSHFSCGQKTKGRIAYAMERLCVVDLTVPIQMS